MTVGRATDPLKVRQKCATIVSGLCLRFGFGLLCVGRAVRDEGCGWELQNPFQKGPRFTFPAEY